MSQKVSFININYIFFILINYKGIGFIKKKGKNKIILLEKDFLLKNIIELKENNINMNEEKKKYELLKKELKNVNKMIRETDNILKKINKHIFILPSDIIGNDKYHNYIVIKSDDDTSPNIKIINEDDSEDNDLNNYIHEELTKEDLKNNNNNHINDYSDKMLYNDNRDNKTQLQSNIIKDNPLPPMELFLISSQGRIIDYNNALNNFYIYFK